ncbi:MAG: hypothetical protein E7434_03050 [Ruminococcaceae bacterium]|nr:hypothetical protein [Oscillospiraceae bacterium]
MERKIKKAFENQTPNVLNAVLAECGGQEKNWQLLAPRPKKHIWRTVTAVAAALAVALGVGFAVWHNRPDKAPQSVTEPTTQTPTETEPTETTIPPTEPVTVATELVSDAYVGKWTDEWGTTYEYALPKINLNSSYAETVNAEIYETYRDNLDENGVLCNTSHRWYETHIYGDILTVLMYHGPEKVVNQDAAIWCFTLNISDGSQATTEEILQAAGVSTEDYFAQVQWSLGNACCSRIPEAHIESYLATDPDSNAVVHAVMQQTVKQSNLESAIPYLTDEGELYFVGTVYTIAGAGLFTEVHGYTETVEKAPYYDELLEHVLRTTDLVTMAYTDKYTANNGKTYLCQIPQMNFGSEYAYATNWNLWQLCEPYLNDEMQLSSMVNISYTTYVHDDVLSLLLTIAEEGKAPSNRAYNFSITDGSKVATAQMIALSGMTEEEYYAKVMHALGNYYCLFTNEAALDATLAMSPFDPNETVYALFAETVSEENYKAAVPFFAEDGSFSVCGKVCNADGAAYHVAHPFNSNISDSPYYEKMLRLYAINVPSDIIASQEAATEAAQAFLASYTGNTYLYEKNALIVHLLPQEIEVRVDRDLFPPYLEAYRHVNMPLVENSTQAILEEAAEITQQRTQQNVRHTEFRTDCEILKCKVSGDYAQVVIEECKTFRYEGEGMDSSLTDLYELLLKRHEGQWLIFALTVNGSLITD